MEIGALLGGSRALRKCMISFILVLGMEMPRLMPIKLTEEWLRMTSLDLKPEGMRAYSVILFLAAMIIALSITLLKSQMKPHDHHEQQRTAFVTEDRQRRQPRNLRFPTATAADEESQEQRNPEDVAACCRSELESAHPFWAISSLWKELF